MLFSFRGQAGCKWKSKLNLLEKWKANPTTISSERNLPQPFFYLFYFLFSFLSLTLPQLIAIIWRKLRSSYLVFSLATYLFKYLALIVVIALHFLLISQRATRPTNPPLGPLHLAVSPLRPPSLFFLFGLRPKTFHGHNLVNTQLISDSASVKYLNLSRVAKLIKLPI